MWQRLSGDVVENIRAVISNDIMRREDKADLKFYVGCDSQSYKEHIAYVTAIVLYETGKGGLGYYMREIEEPVPMRHRLWNETYKAVTTATWLNQLLIEFDYRVDEVHADLNSDEKHLSQSSVTECLGFITSMGFVGKIKPEAWVASGVADQKT